MSNQLFRTSLTALSLCLGLSVAACGGNAAGTDDEASDANAAMSQSSAIEYMLTNPISSNDAATAASSLAAAQWWPAGCATRAKDSSNPIVTVTLNNCSGPFGLLKWSGTLTVTFAKNTDGTLNVKASSTNMTANGSPASFSLDRNITINGTSTTREVKGSANWTRTNAAGTLITHSNSWTAMVDSGTKCRTLNGTAATTIGTQIVASTAKDYKICRTSGVDGCPSGTLSHISASGDVVSVTFDGTSNAIVTGPRGTRTVGLICQ